MSQDTGLSPAAQPLITSQTPDGRGPTARPRMGRLRRLGEDIRRTPNALIGLAIVSLFLILAAIGPYIVPHPATEMAMLNQFAPPSFDHPFGTDAFGRDVLSRIIVGARLSFLLAATATLFAIVLGTPLGLVAGYVGGWVDEVLMRLSDTLLALPSIILALVIVTTLGSSLINVVLAIAIVYAPRIARVVRGGTLALRDQEFVQAARARGESGSYVIFSEILPNTVAPLIVEASIRMGFAILLATSLSFLGLGASPPAPDWGLMINEARLQVFRAPWLTIFPSIAIGLTIVGFNLLGDGIRDILDPRRVWTERKSEGV